MARFFLWPLLFEKLSQKPPLFRKRQIKKNHSSWKKSHWLFLRGKMIQTKTKQKFEVCGRQPIQKTTTLVKKKLRQKARIVQKVCNFRNNRFFFCIRDNFWFVPNNASFFSRFQTIFCKILHFFLNAFFMEKPNLI